MMTANEVARIFEVDRDTVKKWAYKFRDYLSSKANPSKGQVRYFTQDDLMVLALVADYWEDEPDCEAICTRLNCRDYYSDRYTAFVYANTSILQDVPDDFQGEYPEFVMYGGQKPLECELRACNGITFTTSFVARLCNSIHREIQEV